MTTGEEPFLLADLALARRLERAEAHGNANFVETRARLFPDSGARWIEVAGAYAMYDGVKSPATQTFGLGLFQMVTPADMGVIEAFLAELEGRPIAAGLMTLSEGVALLAGASTIPESRQQGAQLALLESRLCYAADHGCPVAMMCAQPGSASQRNAERQGFRIAYTRIKWRLD